MEYVYVMQKKLKDLEGKEFNNPFEGSIKVKFPKYRERIKKQKEIKRTLNENAELVDRDLYDQVDLLCEFIESIILEMNVSLKKSGEKLASLEEMLRFKEGQFVMLNLGNVILDGIDLGESLSKS